MLSVPPWTAPNACSISSRCCWTRASPSPGRSCASASPRTTAAARDEAAERKFERDKAELLELGIPLTYVQGDDERQDGYLVDREAYYLPEADLTPEELAVLYAAGLRGAGLGRVPRPAGPGARAAEDRLLRRRRAAHPARADGAGRGAGERRSWPSASRRSGTAASARKWVEIAYASPQAHEPTDAARWTRTGWRCAAASGRWWATATCARGCAPSTSTASAR